MVKKLLFSHRKSGSDCQTVLMNIVEGQLFMHLFSLIFLPFEGSAVTMHKKMANFLESTFFVIALFTIKCTNKNSD